MVGYVWSAKLYKAVTKKTAPRSAIKDHDVGGKIERGMMRTEPHTEATEVWVISESGGDRLADVATNYDAMDGPNA